MKRILSVWICFIVASVAAQQPIATGVAEDTVRKLLFDLSADDMEGREAGTPGIEKAAAYLEKFLVSNGIQPYFTSYRDTIYTYTKVTSNIVGYIPGNDPALKNEFLILSAHYDHIGLGSGPGDVVNNGANDDASGVVVAAELARVIAQERSNARSILIVFFTAEEKGLLGSSHLAKKLKQSGIDLYAMINFEMVGVPMNREYTAYLSGYDKSNMASVMNKHAGRQLVGFLPAELKYKLFMRSDNFPFYKAFSIPAQTICTFDFENYDFYHHVDDEAEKMDIGHMTQFTSDMLPVIQKILNTRQREIKLNE